MSFTSSASAPRNNYTPTTIKRTPPLLLTQTRPALHTQGARRCGCRGIRPDLGCKGSAEGPSNPESGSVTLTYESFRGLPEAQKTCLFLRRGSVHSFLVLHADLCDLPCMGLLARCARHIEYTYLNVAPQQCVQRLGVSWATTLFG